jgi:hypothetical protein
MVIPREDTTCAKQNLEPKKRASAREWRSAFSEASEKSVAINTDRGFRAAAMGDMVDQTPFLPLNKTSGEVRATRSVTAWGELGSSATHPYFTDGPLARAHELFTTCKQAANPY